MKGNGRQEPASNLYAELEGEQVGISLLTTKTAEKLEFGAQTGASSLKPWRHRQLFAATMSSFAHDGWLEEALMHQQVLSL